MVARMLAILVTTTTSSSTFATIMQSRLGTLMSLKLVSKKASVDSATNDSQRWMYHVLFFFLKVCDVHPPRIAGVCFKQTICRFMFVMFCICEFTQHKYTIQCWKVEKNIISLNMFWDAKVQNEIKHHLP